MHKDRSKRFRKRVGVRENQPAIEGSLDKEEWRELSGYCEGKRGNLWLSTGNGPLQQRTSRAG